MRLSREPAPARSCRHRLLAFSKESTETTIAETAARTKAASKKLSEYDASQSPSAVLTTTAQPMSSCSAKMLLLRNLYQSARCIEMSYSAHVSRSSSKPSSGLLVGSRSSRTRSRTRMLTPSRSDMLAAWKFGDDKSSRVQTVQACMAFR
eukprot:4205211-Prymnesium_polylepis.1